MGMFVVYSNPLNDRSSWGWGAMAFETGRHMAVYDWPDCNISVWLVPGTWRDEI